MIQGLEKKFFSAEDVEGLMKGRSEIVDMLRNHSLEDALWVMLPKGIADIINAKRIEQDNIEVYTRTDQLINASNQHFWAYAAINPTSQLPIITEFAEKIVAILWDTEIIASTEENSQEFMRKALYLADKALQIKEFRDEEMKHILSSYVKKGRMTGETSKDLFNEDPLLMRFLKDMLERSGVYETLDFFDENILDGHFTHPFPQRGFTFDEPVIIKRDILRYIQNQFGCAHGSQLDPTHKEEIIRINKTIANFNYHAETEMLYLMFDHSSPYTSNFFFDQIRNCIEQVEILTGLKGQDFVNFLEQEGFEAGVRRLYMWDYERHTGKKFGEPYTADAAQNNITDLPFEVSEALKTLGLDGLPQERKVAKSAYYRLTRLWHPDYCDLPGAEETTKKANNAWEVLEKHYKSV